MATEDVQTNVLLWIALTFAFVTIPTSWFGKIVIKIIYSLYTVRGTNMLFVCYLVWYF